MNENFIIRYFIVQTLGNGKFFTLNELIHKINLIIEKLKTHGYNVNEFNKLSIIDLIEIENNIVTLSNTGRRLLELTFD